METTRPILMTASEVAEYLGLPEYTVREMGRTGAMPVLKVGRLVRWTKDGVDAWVALNTQSQHYDHPKRR